MKDAQVCKKKIIAHVEKEFMRYNLNPLDRLCDIEIDHKKSEKSEKNKKGGNGDEGEKREKDNKNYDPGSLELMCQYDLGDICCKFLDTVIKKRVELKRLLTGEEIEDIMSDVIKNVDEEDIEKIMKFRKYLGDINNKSDVKKPMYSDREAADEALAH